MPLYARLLYAMHFPYPVLRTHPTGRPCCALLQRSLKPSKVKTFMQGHTAAMLQSWNPNPGLTPNSMLLGPAGTAFRNHFPLF